MESEQLQPGKINAGIRGHGLRLGTRFQGFGKPRDCLGDRPRSSHCVRFIWASYAISFREPFTAARLIWQTLDDVQRRSSAVSADFRLRFLLGQLATMPLRIGSTYRPEERRWISGNSFKPAVLSASVSRGLSRFSRLFWMISVGLGNDCSGRLYNFYRKTDRWWFPSFHLRWGKL